MDAKSGSVDRRAVLRGVAATAALVPLAGIATACAGGGVADAPEPSTEEQPTTPSSSSDAEINEASADTSNSPTSDADGGANPFGLQGGSSVNAVIFNGGYGFDYVSFAADLAAQHNDGVTFDIQPSTQIATELQPQFVSGNPPDLVNNSGADTINFSTIIGQLDTLDDVFGATNYDGTVIADTLYSGVREPGVIDGKFIAINYIMVLYAVWYSGSLFEENGWTPPRTWDEAIELGAKAKQKDKYLWVWGKEAATYYQNLAMDSAIKEGGDEVRLALENLEPNCWSHPAVQSVFKAIETCVTNGYFIPGGSGTQFTDAQAKWANDQQALLYPSGSWIENEMKNATKSGFQMRGVPVMTVTDSPMMPYEAVHNAANTPFCVPSTAANSSGGKELLRAMLSKEAAMNFSKTRLASTIVSGTVPEDGFGSTALVSQSKMLTEAGDNVFNVRFSDFYGMNTDQLVAWNSFLAGDLDVAGLTNGLQKISDDIANDESIAKIVVS